MKGTAPRGRTLEEDARQARWLQTSTKNQAENLMIVDMVRNDLGRIAIPDTVEVSELWHLEKYPSLFQLTSTVEAAPRLPSRDIFAALFPCASVTGAPKVRSMEIIRELEQGPRGAYTGAIGLIGPGRRARFNVAIRTVDVDTVAGRASYGTGSGVVWDSVAREEWRRVLDQGPGLAIPSPRVRASGDDSLGSGTGIRFAGATSAAARGFRGILRLSSRSLQDRRGARSSDPRSARQPQRVRLLVSSRGIVRVESAPLDRHTGPWRLAVADGAGGQ